MLKNYRERLIFDFSLSVGGVRAVLKTVWSPWLSVDHGLGVGSSHNVAAA